MTPGTTRRPDRSQSGQTTSPTEVSRASAPRLSGTAAWTGGVALLLIAVLAGVGFVGLLTPLITPGDAARTAHDIAAAGLRFRVGVLCLLAAALLDVVVAAALLALLERVNRMVALTAAWFRVAYSAVFLVAITQLVTVPSLVDEPGRAMDALDSYGVIWRTGLILFAVHLLLVAYLAYRSGFMPRILAILIGTAGGGYLVDGVGTAVATTYVPTVSTFTFVGEVALIVWLLWKAIRIRTGREVVAGLLE